MPRIGSKQRFAFLEKAAKASGLAASPTSPVGRYLAYKKQEVPLKRRKTLTAAQIASQRETELLALVPFGLTVGGAYVAADFRAATVSQWSRTYVNNVTGLADTDLGWRGYTATVIDAGDYYPALLKVSIPTAQVDPDATSPITGRKYKYTAQNSYTIPFGRGNTPAQGELTRRNALFAIFKGLTGGAKPSSVSYVPEYFDPMTEAAGAVPGLTDAPAT